MSSSAEGSKMSLVRNGIFVQAVSPLVILKQDDIFLSGPFFIEKKCEKSCWRELLIFLFDFFFYLFFLSQGSHHEPCCGAVPKVESIASHEWDGNVHLRIAVTNLMHNIYKCENVNTPKA